MFLFLKPNIFENIYVQKYKKTILQWSFVRDDQPRETTSKQIALAIRDEVVDLEKAGIKVIQIDEQYREVSASPFALDIFQKPPVVG